MYTGRIGRMSEWYWVGLENRSLGNTSGGSNPSPSALINYITRINTLDGYRLLRGVGIIGET